MIVNEIFRSCQGEGLSVFEPTVFVRLSGCNLAIAGKPCRWCDTPHAWAVEGKTMSPQAIVRTIDMKFEGTKRVCITGGEPLCQELELEELVDVLKFRGYFVEIFTNGTRMPSMSLFHVVDSWIVDIKCPSSGVAQESCVFSWMELLRSSDVAKFVVADDLDLHYLELATRVPKMRCHIIVSPCITADLLDSPGPQVRKWLQSVWDYCVQNNLRYGLQVHKVVFGNREGV